MNCDQWRDDYNNCQKYSWLTDKEAATSLIQSELSRRAKRMKAHYDNDIWTKRDKPPADWTKPLPPFMEERNKNTFLEKKAQELKEEEEKERLRALNPEAAAELNKNSFCTFM